MIKTFFTGRLGRDAETKHIANGTALAGFPVAVDVGYGDRKDTIWLDCTIFGKRAESKLIEYLTKGQQVAVSGDLSKREHEGKTYLQVRVDDIDLVGGRSESGPRPAHHQEQVHSDDLEDSIPF